MHYLCNLSILLRKACRYCKGIKMAPATTALFQTCYLFITFWVCRSFACITSDMFNQIKNGNWKRVCAMVILFIMSEALIPLLFSSNSCFYLRCPILLFRSHLKYVWVFLYCIFFQTNITRRCTLRNVFDFMFKGMLKMI